MSDTNVSEVKECAAPTSEAEVVADAPPVEEAEDATPTEEQAAPDSERRMQTFIFACAACSTMLQARLAEGNTTVQCKECSAIFATEVRERKEPPAAAASKPRAVPRARVEPSDPRQGDPPPGWNMEQRLSKYAAAHPRCHPQAPPD